jgi:N-acetylneuraminic acid mutarotase
MEGKHSAEHHVDDCEPQVTKRAKVAGGGHKLIVAGGCGEIEADGFYYEWDKQRSDQKAVLQLDLSTKQWSRLADMPEPRVMALGGVIDGKLIVAGGFNRGTSIQYDFLTSDTWTKLANLPLKQLPMVGSSSAVYNSQMAGGSQRCKYNCSSSIVLDGKLVIPAFTLGTGEYGLQPAQRHRDVIQYDPVTDTWSELQYARLPKPFHNPTAVIWDGQLCVVGGAYKDGGTSACKLTAEGWVSLPELPSAREAPIVAILDGKLIVMGGWGHSGVCKSILQLDAGTWERIGTWDDARAEAATWVIDNDLIIAGGCTKKTGKGKGKGKGKGNPPPERSVLSFTLGTMTFTDLAADMPITLRQTAVGLWSS